MVVYRVKPDIALQADTEEMPVPDYIFKCSNEAALCAGMSSHWLKQSLKNNLMKAMWEQTDSVAGLRLHKELANQSIDRLEQMGLKLRTTAVVMTNETWVRIVESLCMQRGYCYLTMKHPAHAMACFVDNTHIYFFDPEIGLLKMTHLEALVTLLKHFKIATGSSKNPEFKIYPVELQPNPHHQKLPGPQT